MLKHTKERHTKSIKLNLVGPANKKAEAVNALLSLGFIEDTDSIPWREAFPETSDQELIGSILIGARNKAGMMQKQLADMTGVHQRHLSEMEHGKRTIGKKNAKLFAKALNTDYRVFL
jgi:ribosome-binding protein aMBF1 (putative translation factor)